MLVCPWVLSLMGVRSRRIEMMGVLMVGRGDDGWDALEVQGNDITKGFGNGRFHCF